jgi:N-acetylmuramoyl-L-alanine amidase
MRWSSKHGVATVSRRAAWVSGLALLVGWFLLPARPPAQVQPEEKELTVYTAQTGYTLPVITRENRDYIGLLEMLEPLGNVSAKLEGTRWKLRFSGRNAQFTVGDVKSKIHNDAVELDGPFLIENGRGLVPLHTLPLIIAEFMPARTFEFHQSSRRFFLDKVAVRYSAEIKRAVTTRLVITFSAPVNPFIATEAGRLRMTFRREPLVSTSPGTPATFEDNVISSLTYGEGNGAAQLTVNGTAPLTASFSSDRKVITIAPASGPSSPVAVQPPPATTPEGTGAPPSPTPALPSLPQPRGFLVLIDAAHGGDDHGGSITDKVAEKEVALAFARRLNTELQTRGIFSRLVREGDATLSLEQRTAVVNGAVPSLYVDVHATGTGTGVHLFTSSVPAAQKAVFLPWKSAQAAYVDLSRTVATAMATELLKHDIPAVDLSAPVAGLNDIAAPALALEVAAPPKATARDLNSPQYQQLVCSAAANVIAAMRSRLPHGEAAR